MLWKLAAAAAIVTAGALVFNGEGRSPESVVARVATAPSAVVVSPAPAPTRDDPTTRAADNIALSLVSGVQDLSDEQIETLLAELDAIESIPAAEPQPVPLSMDDVEVEG